MNKKTNLSLISTYCISSYYKTDSAQDEMLAFGNVALIQSLIFSFSILKALILLISVEY